MQKKYELHGSLENILPPPHSFGQSIAINDNYIVIGADDLSMLNTHECGGIYIFDNKYKELQCFYTDRNKSFYGWDVSITDDDTIIVGADDENNNTIYNGSCFIFKKKPTGEFYVYKKMFAKYDKERAYYGYAIACNKTHVAISAPSYQSTTNNILHTGFLDYHAIQPYVYIYDLKNFELCHILTIDHPTLPNIFSSFGCNIRFNEKYLVITEHTYNRVYVYDANSFDLITTYLNVGCSSIDLDGDLLISGDPKQRTVTLTDIKSGSDLYLLKNEDIDNYGYKVAISNNTIAIASNINTVYLYDNVVMNKGSMGKVFIYKISNGSMELHDIRDQFYQSMKFHKNKLYCGNPIANDLYGVVDVYTT